MTCPRALIAEALALHWDELPRVMVRVQCQLEDTERVRDHLAIGMNRHGQRRALAARPHVDRADPLHVVHDAVGRHRLEPLVLVLLAVQDEIAARRIEAGPEIFPPLCPSAAAGSRREDTPPWGLGG